MEKFSEPLFSIPKDVETQNVKSMTDSSDDSLSNYGESLMPAICYACAYLVYNIFEMPNVAEQMLKIAVQVLPKIQ